MALRRMIFDNQAPSHLDSRPQTTIATRFQLVDTMVCGNR